MIDGKVTPERVANDLESVTTVVGMMMQYVTFLALPPDNEEGDGTKVSTKMAFKKDLKSSFRKIPEDGCGVRTNVHLKQSIDEVFEAWADKLNNEVGENGDFLRYCPLYGVKLEEHEELELQIPCCC